MKILVADDNRDILDTTALILELDGHEVVTVQRTGAIITTALTERPDVILQDVHMPGLTLNRHLEALGSNRELRTIPVLLFSGEDPAPGLLGYPSVIGFLGKPFQFEDLREWLVRVAERDLR